MDSQPMSQSMNATTNEFLNRMELDTQTRRRDKFINELSAKAHGLMP